MTEFFGDHGGGGKEDRGVVGVGCPDHVHRSAFFDQSELDMAVFLMCRQSHIAYLIKRMSFFDLFPGAEESTVEKHPFFKVQHHRCPYDEKGEYDDGIEYSEQHDRRKECPCNERQT